MLPRRGATSPWITRHYGTPPYHAQGYTPLPRQERGQAADLKLRGLVSSVMLRRNNEVIAKYLPAKYELVVFCVLTEAQKQLYRQELWA